MSYGDKKNRKNLDLAKGMCVGFEDAVAGHRVQTSLLCEPWHNKHDIGEVNVRCTMCLFMSLTVYRV